MDLDLQGKLLRFVQTGEFQRVGDSTPQRVDVRLICATNRDPLGEVRRGRFREDLYYRLHVLPIALPPLRERGDDVLLLARRFLRAFAREEGRALADFAPDAVEALLAHPWPGNVRELENFVRSVVVLNDGPSVTRAMIPERLWVSRAQGATEQPVTSAPTPPATPVAIVPLEQVEREAIERALAHFDGHVPSAAAALKVSASTLYRKLQAWQSNPGSRSATGL